MFNVDQIYDYEQLCNVLLTVLQVLFS